MKGLRCALEINYIGDKFCERKSKTNTQNIQILYRTHKCLQNQCLHTDVQFNASLPLILWNSCYYNVII